MRRGKPGMDKGDDVGGSGISRDAGGGGGEKIVLNGRILSDHRPSDPYNTGTEHVGSLNEERGQLIYFLP